MGQLQIVSELADRESLGNIPDPVVMITEQHDIDKQALAKLFWAGEHEHLKNGIAVVYHGRLKGRCSILNTFLGTLRGVFAD